MKEETTSNLSWWRKVKGVVDNVVVEEELDKVFGGEWKKYKANDWVGVGVLDNVNLSTNEV